MPLFRATAEGDIQLTSEEEAEWNALQVELALQKTQRQKLQYQQNRAAEYPPIGDQLDALWKGGDAATAMLAQVQAVKAKYPKSE